MRPVWAFNAREKWLRLENPTRPEVHERDRSIPLKVVRPETGLLRYARQEPGTDLLIVVKSESEVRIPSPL